MAAHPQSWKENRLIFAYLDLLDVSVTAFFVFFAAVVVSLLVGISFHEFSHALTADALGDPMPRAMGRVSLNPVAHLDPTGTVLLILGGFGWGKPVPVNPNRFRNRSKFGMAIVAAAGPLSNLLLAIVFSIPIRALGLPVHFPFDLVRFQSWGGSDYFGLFFTSLVIFNLILFVFNLIPIAPLDGFRVVLGLLPRGMALALAKLEPWGPGVLFLIIALPFVTGFSLLGRFMFPLVDRMASALIGA